MEPYYQDESVTLYNGDCREVMPQLDTEAQLILTDPPYFRVKGEAWDRQWKDADAFIEWLDGVAALWSDRLAHNGSLYCCASPKMAARVEVMIAERFETMNRIRWVKDAGWHKKTRPEDLRSYLSPWEEIIFAGHYGTNIGEQLWIGRRDEIWGEISKPLRKYFVDGWATAGLEREHANTVCGFRHQGGMASRKYFSVSQWQLPRAEHYAKLQDAAGGHLPRAYEELRAEYEELRAEYEERREIVREEIRAEYEELRRPFNVTPDVPFTDVWDFPTVNSYPGKHPTEKPAALLEHAIRTSSRDGDLVLDTFAGTGSTLIAARALGRRAIGIEASEEYCERAVARLAQESLALAVA